MTRFRFALRRSSIMILPRPVSSELNLRGMGVCVKFVGNLRQIKTPSQSSKVEDLLGGTCERCLLAQVRRGTPEGNCGRTGLGESYFRVRTKIGRTPR